MQHIYAAKASCTQYQQSTKVLHLYKRKCVYVKYSYTFTTWNAKFADECVCSTISLRNSILLQSAYIIFTFTFNYVQPYCSTNMHCSSSNGNTTFVVLFFLFYTRLTYFKPSGSSFGTSVGLYYRFLQVFLWHTITNPCFMSLLKYLCARNNIYQYNS